MADAHVTPASTRPVRLSSLIRDPILRAVFERAERDYGQSFAIPDEPIPALDGGAAEPAGEHLDVEVVS